MYHIGGSVWQDTLECLFCVFDGFRATVDARRGKHSHMLSSMNESPPPRSLLITAQFMKPLKCLASSFCRRDQRQLQPRCENLRIHDESRIFWGSLIF